MRYCPPLDTSLFLVILSDYDLNDATKVQEACDILDSLAASAATEEASGFDASGSSSVAYPEVDGGHTELITNDDIQSDLAGSSSSPDDTSLSTGMSSMDLEDDSPECKEHDAQLESLDREGKIAIISSIFPGVKMLDIELTLRRYQNNAGKAIDELLNIVLLEETGSRLRGVDGFSGSDEVRRRRKKGRKKKLLENDDSEASSSSTAPVSKWETAKRDIEFISTQTNCPVKQVTSLYHDNGASTPNTIRAIGKSQKSLNIANDDPNLEIFAAEIALEFPTIPQDQVRSLAELTFPATSAAHKLAKALTQRPDSNERGGVQIEWRLRPPDINSEPTSSNLRPSNSLYPENYDYSERPGHNSYAYGPKTADEARALRDKHFIQANTAYRKGTSSNYQGAVAAYYASQGRDYDVMFQGKRGAEADALVASQSSRNVLDLHGVSVKDAVRISREKVNAWWAGRNRETGSSGEGYRIVTGIGRHSVGVAKLGPAVGRMLIREGWKVEAETGHLLVTGVLGALKRRK